MRSVYTQKLLHREVFTQRSIYTQHFFYTQQAGTPRNLVHPEHFYTQETLTQKSFYTEKPLDAASFYTDMPSKTDEFTHGGFYTQKLLRKQPFAN